MMGWLTMPSYSSWSSHMLGPTSVGTLLCSLFPPGDAESPSAAALQVGAQVRASGKMAAAAAESVSSRGSFTLRILPARCGPVCGDNLGQNQLCYRYIYYRSQI